MITEWNFNMDEAPRGYTKEVERKGPKGQMITQEVFVPEKIIACDDRDCVTVSYWIPPKEGKDGRSYTPGRWAMFATGQTPMAWQPWPTHPDWEDV